MHKTEFTELREQAGLTLEEAALVLEVSDRTAYRYESGASNPPRLAISTLRAAAGQRSHQPGQRKFRFIDLFAGIGGLRLGFEPIGGECVFTSEWDKYSQMTYRKNFPEAPGHVFAGDIREFTTSPEALQRIPSHDVLLAGFPCQPFSIAGVSKKNSLGRQHGFLDETQGTLFFDVAKILEHHRPAAFLLENVKNLHRHDSGRTFATIMNVLEKDLGYHVQARIVSSEPWVPQKRERIFIVGFRDPTAFSFETFQVPALPGPKLGSILLPPDEVGPKYTLTAHLWQYLQNYKAKHAAAGNGFGFGMFGPADVARTLSARYYKDGSEILIDQGPGRVPRRLTPTECARLMGFERDGRRWETVVSDTQAYKQFGNAVVVPAVEAVAHHMEPHLLEALGHGSRVVRPFQQPDVEIYKKVAVNG
ncbi:DNA (cytosine-5-)-methyltransferase [Rhizobium sp. DKSPLA3]|uniref:Cytosine-specific methyltransferase n=1 Tax=Rhizobium quercicola TaxID=2901226 RepID=A0A9X1T9G1_9HYPH|nr:DNA (cytosine-5-)-methyltransferase [Rhizobium quercicola]MCD7111838.1 DNA (cytosine-5-)-methyltransferase [Rhizobium quercicola]